MSEMTREERIARAVEWYDEATRRRDEAHAQEREAAKVYDAARSQRERCESDLRVITKYVIPAALNNEDTLVGEEPWRPTWERA